MSDRSLLPEEAPTAGDPFCTDALTPEARQFFVVMAKAAVDDPAVSEQDRAAGAIMLRFEASLVALEASAQSVTAPMPYPEDQGSTHYDGCWSQPRHHDCAVEEINRLRSLVRTDNSGVIAELQRRLDRAEVEKKALIDRKVRPMKDTQGDWWIADGCMERIAAEWYLRFATPDAALSAYLGTSTGGKDG